MHPFAIPPNEAPHEIVLRMRSRTLQEFEHEPRDIQMTQDEIALRTAMHRIVDHFGREMAPKELHRSIDIPHRDRDVVKTRKPIVSGPRRRGIVVKWLP